MYILEIIRNFSKILPKMKEININIEGYNLNGICVGCLNYNRKMFYDDEVKECFKFLGEIDVPDGLTIQVCWECLAAVRNIRHFQFQILKAYDVLIEYSQQHTFLNSPEDFTKHATTRLATSPVQTLDSSHFEIQVPIEDKSELKQEGLEEYLELETDVKPELEFIEDTHFMDELLSQEQDNQSSDEDIQLRKEMSDGAPMSIPRQLKRPREEDVTMETPPPPAKRDTKASEITTANGVTILKSHENAIESRKHKKTGRAVENKPANTTYQNTADRRNAPDKDTQNLCKEENLLPAMIQDRTVETTEVKGGATERGSFEHKHTGLSYVCDSCQYCSGSKGLLERHMRFHDDRRPFHCGTCGFRFLSKFNLHTHKIIHGINLNNIKMHECNICSYKTPHSTALKGHLLIHAGKRPYSCDMCNQSFRQASNLKRHQRMHTGEKPYTCESCEKRYTQADHLKRHQKTHTGEKLFKCEKCEKRFIDASYLKTHKRSHTGEKPYKCETCEKRFTEASSFKKHQRMHTGEKPYKCESCEKRFTQAGNLKTHQRTHTGEKLFKCEKCEKRFTRASYLKTHERSHTGEKPYKCEKCEKRFTQASYFKTHERTHTGEKPYKCSTCEKIFTQAVNLKRHQRTHIGEKPYKCSTCEKSFSQASQLKAHKRVHTGEKPYICNICEYRSGDSSALRRHLRTHIGRTVGSE